MPPLTAHGFREIPGPGGFRFSDVTVVMRDSQNNVKVDILPGDPGSPGNPRELPRQRSTFGDVQIRYRVVQQQVAAR